ncbi:MAG: outer membrane beta-barrel protein [Anaeromyxobacteraceae bacterium]
MRKIVLAAALAVAFAPAARAQTTRDQGTAGRTAIGFGVGIEPLNLVTGATASGSLGASLDPGSAPIGIYVPIQVAANLRIEPVLGYWHVSGNRAALANVGGNGDNSRSATTLGLGALFYLQPVNPTGIYAGARLGLTFQSASALDNAGVQHDLSETDLAIAPVFGGEYAFAQRFTFGAEVQLPFTFYGNVSDKTPGLTVTTNTDRSGLRTNAVVFMRYFFM